MKNFILICGGLLAALFVAANWPNLIVFSNDGPLGQVASAKCNPPGCFVSIWDDQNWLGSEAPAVSFGPSGGIRMLSYFIPNMALFWFLIIIFAWTLWSLHKRGKLKQTLGIGAWALALIIAIATYFRLDSEILNCFIPIGCIYMIGSTIVILSYEN